MRPTLFPAACLVFIFSVGASLVARAAEESQPGGGARTGNVTLSPFTVLAPSDPGFLEHELAAYGLKPLGAEPVVAGEECLRFLWVRSFHRAALFEVRFAADGTGVFEAKLWEKTPEGGHWAVQRSKPLESEVRVTHRRSLDRIGFFGLPFADGRGGFDGATWLFEAREGGRSHAVHRWSPEAGPLRSLGVSLIEAAIQSEFLPVY